MTSPCAAGKHTCLAGPETQGQDSLAHSSGQEGRVGSCPGSGSVGLGYSSPEGRGTGWHTWCLKSKFRWLDPAWESSPALGWGRRQCHSPAGPVPTEPWPQLQEPLLTHHFHQTPWLCGPGPGSTEPQNMQDSSSRWSAVLKGMDPQVCNAKIINIFIFQSTWIYYGHGGLSLGRRGLLGSEVAAAS